MKNETTATPKRYNVVITRCGKQQMGNSRPLTEDEAEKLVADFRNADPILKISNPHIQETHEGRVI